MTKKKKEEIKKEIPEDELIVLDSNTRYFVIFGIIIAVIIGIVLMIKYLPTHPFKELDDVDKSCKKYYELLEKNKYLKLDTNISNVENGSTNESIDCVRTINEKLGFKDLYDEMIETSTLDGLKTSSNYKYKVVWMYNNNTGLEAIYSEIK